jgi:hypothetical protein
MNSNTINLRAKKNEIGTLLITRSTSRNEWIKCKDDSTN